jgi:hypothetical protein
MQRWRERLDADGYSGLVDRRKARPSDKRVPVATVEEVLRLYREEYFDLNMRHFHENLKEKHAIELSYTFVQKALQGAGLVARGRKRRKHRRRREDDCFPRCALRRSSVTTSTRRGGIRRVSRRNGGRVAKSVGRETGKPADPVWREFRMSRVGSDLLEGASRQRRVRHRCPANQPGGLHQDVCWRAVERAI